MKRLLVIALVLLLAGVAYANKSVFDKIESGSAVTVVPGVAVPLSTDSAIMLPAADVSKIHVNTCIWCNLDSR